MLDDGHTSPSRDVPVSLAVSNCARLTPFPTMTASYSHASRHIILATAGATFWRRKYLTMMVFFNALPSVWVVLGVIPYAALAFSKPNVPVLFDSTNHLHRDLRYHPEQPERITACLKALSKYKSQVGDRLELIDVATSDWTHIDDVKVTYFPFSDEELAHAKAMLHQAHTEDLVSQLEERCRSSKQRRLDESKNALGHMGYIDGDTFLTTESFDVCLRATAAWIRAVDLVAASSGSASMALTRPPGHHATKSVSNGFCIFNFGAAAALHVLQDPNKRVSVIDWDVHYGQGVADILENCPRARYVSIHQSPAFPYMGEKLTVEGKHENVYTIPMPPETSWTCGYEQLFEKAIHFACEPGKWEPDVVIVCAGYDALDSDDLASACLTAADFGKMTSRLYEHLANTRPDRMPSIVIGLEGGYQLSEMAGGGNLPQAVLETVSALLEKVA